MSSCAVLHSSRPRQARLDAPGTLHHVMVREDLRRYPHSKIGEISARIGAEINRSQLKRALADLVRSGTAVMEGQRAGARYRLADES